MWWLFSMTAGADTWIDGRTSHGELPTDEAVIVVPGDPKVDLGAFSVVSDEGAFTLDELVLAADKLAGEPIFTLIVLQDGVCTESEELTATFEVDDPTIGATTCATVFGFTLCWST